MASMAVLPIAGMRTEAFQPVSYGQFHPPAKARVSELERVGNVSSKLSKDGGSLLAAAGASEAKRWVSEETNGASAHRPPARAPDAPTGQRDPTSGTPRLLQSQNPPQFPGLKFPDRHLPGVPERSGKAPESASCEKGRARRACKRSPRLQIARPASSAGAGQGRCNPP